MSKRRFAKVHSQVVVTNSVDHSTGELLDQSVEQKDTVVTANTREDFFLVFSAVMGAVNGLTPVEQDLVTFSCLNCQMNRNLIVFNKQTKEHAAKVIEVKPQTVANAVASLAKKGVLVPLGSGSYLINPNYYWRGSTKVRLKQIYNLKLILEGKKDVDVNMSDLEKKENNWKEQADKFNSDKNEKK